MNGDYYQQPRSGADAYSIQNSLPFMNFGTPQAPQQVQPVNPYASGYQQQPYVQQPPLNYYQPPPMQSYPSFNNGMASGYAPQPYYEQPQASVQPAQPIVTAAPIPDASAPTRHVRQPVFKKYVKSTGTLSTNDVGKKSFRVQQTDNGFLTRLKWKFNWNQIWCYEDDYELTNYPNALQLVTCGSDPFVSGVQIWNRYSGEATCGTIKVNDGAFACNAVDVNPRAGTQGVIAVFGGSTNGARLTLWDVEKAKVKKELLFTGESEFSCGACTWNYGTGAALAGSAKDSTIRVYDIERGCFMRKITLPESHVVSIVIDPYSPTVFYVALDNGTIQCFDLYSPQEQPTITFGTTVDTSNGGQAGTKGIVGFARPRRERSSTYRSIAAAGPREVRLWDLSSPSVPVQLLKAPDDKLFSGMGFSGDTICTYAEELQMWNLLSSDLKIPTAVLPGGGVLDCGATMKMTSTSVFYSGKVGPDLALFEVNLL